MAKDKPKKPLPKKSTPVPEEPGGFAALLDDKVVVYSVAVAAVFVVGCLVAGGMFMVKQTADEKVSATSYAEALDAEGAEARLEQLEPVAQGETEAAVLALHRLGWEAFHAQEHDKAKAAFLKLRQEHPESRFVGEAVEGVGLIAEQTGDLEEALARYREILEQWPGSFAAQRQQLNIARVQEALGKPEEAVAAYRAQRDAFPGSHVAADAQTALDRLSRLHPDLFATVTEAETPAEPAADDGTGEPGEIEQPTLVPAPASDSGEEQPVETEPAAEETPGS